MSHSGIMSLHFVDILYTIYAHTSGTNVHINGSLGSQRSLNESTSLFAHTFDKLPVTKKDTVARTRSTLNKMNKYDA